MIIKMYKMRLLMLFICFQVAIMAEGVRVTRMMVDEIFDQATSSHQTVYEYTLRNEYIIVKMVSYGAAVRSILMPDKHGNVTDICLGFDDIQGYQNENNPYMGATIGRVANRVRNASFTLDNRTYTIASRNSNYSLHGGLVNFAKRNWFSYIENNKVYFSLLSADGDQGFPGDLLVNLTVELTEDSLLKMDFEARTSKTTIINLTNHAYFNLAGESSGWRNLYEHTLTVDADYITETDENFLPTGSLINVTNTPYDFRTPVRLGNILPDITHGGLDNNFCINLHGEDRSHIRKSAILYHDKSGRQLEVFSNQPGCQVYTSNHLLGDGEGDTTTGRNVLTGKHSGIYYKHAGICLESQDYPDAINQPTFPSIVLRPNDTYNRSIHWKFSVIR